MSGGLTEKSAAGQTVLEMNDFAPGMPSPGIERSDRARVSTDSLARTRQRWALGPGGD